MDSLKKLTLTILTFSLIAYLDQHAQAQFIDTEWRVIDYFGEAWFAKPPRILGKTQMFHKGFAEGIFYECNLEGQSKTYTRYTLPAFLDNPEFEIFRQLNSKLKLNDKEVFVHRITCSGNHRVLYPFVTIEPGNKAYYLFEGMVYVFERQVAKRD